MSDQDKTSTPYKESDDHVPNPLFVSGTVDTTGTGGDLAQSVNEISSVFTQARAAALGAALNAVDGHPEGAPESVILPEEEKSHDEAIADLRAAAESAQEDADAGLTPAKAEAAEEGEPVNPNALNDDNHDYSEDGPSAPATTNADGVSSDGAAVAESGVPNVHPNAESVEQAENGGVQPTVIDDDNKDSVPEQRDSESL